MGPIQVLLIGFDQFTPTGGIADELEKLSDAGTIRIIDARLVHRTGADSVTAARISDLTEEEMAEFRATAGALIGLGVGATMGDEDAVALGAALGAAAGEAGPSGLGADAIAEIGSDLLPGQAVVLLVLEQLWASELRDALVASGGSLLDSGYLTADGLVALGALLGVEAQLEG